MRIEDVYCNKFHKEPYIMHHIYAQYFHPSTLLERVRDVRFYRQPRTIFKGFKVPDWATSKEKHGWEVDAYSRNAWDNAMQDMKSEWTPVQHPGERQEPNPLQWLRSDHLGQGFGDRLFYNEVPQLNTLGSWWRNGGYVAVNEDDREQHKMLHSFTNANQDRQIDFGIDTTTPEGREAFKKEWDALAELAPEMIKKEDLVFPHEQAPAISQEPHFQRVWQHYRDHSFNLAFANGVETGAITEADADAFKRFVGMQSAPCINVWIMAKTGKMDHLKDDEGFQASMRVMSALGMDAVEFNFKTAEPLEHQFWEQFDGMYELTEASMKEDLPMIVTDPSNRAAIEAILSQDQEKLE